MGGLLKTSGFRGEERMYGDGGWLYPTNPRYWVGVFDKAKPTIADFRQELSIQGTTC